MFEQSADNENVACETPLAEDKMPRQFAAPLVVRLLVKCCIKKT